MSEIFTSDEIVPIPARCPKCSKDWTGVDAIRAPSLHNVYCFWCPSVKLVPHPELPPVVDALTRRMQERAYRQTSVWEAAS